MGLIKEQLGNSVGIGVGLTAMTFGVLPAGTDLTAVSLGALATAVLGKHAKFGPECARVRKDLLNRLMKDYKKFITVEGDEWHLHADLEAAHTALEDCLAHCVIDRTKLAKSAVTPAGFPDEAVKVIFADLANQREDLFGKGKEDTLPYRFAKDVVRATITEAVSNLKYYEQLEPELMFELARTIGELMEIAHRIDETTQETRDDVKELKQFQTEQRAKLEQKLEELAKELHTTTSVLQQLVGEVLDDIVLPNEAIVAAKHAFAKLKELRENWGDMQGMANDAPEIAALLEEADTALSEGPGFSLDKAEHALEKADKRYEEIITERLEQTKIASLNRAKILGKRAEMAALKFQYAKAEQLYREQLKCLTTVHGDEHEDVATCLNCIAYYLDDQGKYKEAYPLCKKALDIRQRILGDEHPDTASSYNNLASNLDNQGNYDEAYTLYKKALDIRQKLSGDEHPATARSYNNLASNFDYQGKYDEAHPLYKKALDIRQKLFGDEHPDTALNYNNLASNLDDQGKYDEAHPLYKKALDIRQKLFGDEHPDTALSYNNLASNLDDQGKYDEAYPIYKTALEIRKNLLGTEHPKTASSYNNLAYILDRQNKFKDAEQLYHKALELRRKLLGETHPDTAWSYNNFAVNLHAQGKYGEAIEMIDKSAALFIKFFGPDHPNTKQVLENQKFICGED